MRVLHVEDAAVLAEAVKFNLEKLDFLQVVDILLDNATKNGNKKISVILGKKITNDKKRRHSRQKIRPRKNIRPLLPSRQNKKRLRSRAFNCKNNLRPKRLEDKMRKRKIADKIHDRLLPSLKPKILRKSEKGYIQY